MRSGSRQGVESVALPVHCFAMPGKTVSSLPRNVFAYAVTWLPFAALEYGVDGVSLSVPVRLGGGGVRRIEQWDLSAREKEALRAGAQFVRKAAEALV